ncbi:MAG: DUF115 domain-containing protein [Lachnospiraceae bacterium]|nr:DUF115 domain-containing protein [Lachnospiraceae bacterium]
MDGFVDQMYQDAMIISDLREIIRQAALCNGVGIGLIWLDVQKRMESFVRRLAEKDIEDAKGVLALWEAAGAGHTDFRQLAAEIERVFLPGLQKYLDIRYPYMEAGDGRWIFQRSDSYYFTVKGRESDRYLHSPVDPMREAELLALDLYRPDLQEFHILGSGLGYLPYQLWKISEYTMKIVVYEDDDILLRNAYLLGVLSWIDEKKIEVVTAKDIDQMLCRFLRIVGNDHIGYYVSDWKRGEYTETGYAREVDSLDFNERTERLNRRLHEINTNHNRMLDLKDIRDLKRSLGDRSKRCAVVSAGPSLNENIMFLRENAATMLIISVNAAMKRLFDERIYPDVVTMLDPRSELVHHLEGIAMFTWDIPLIMPVTGSYTFAEDYKGPTYLMPDNDEVTDGYKWGYGGTVSSMALDIAYYFGAQEIYLIGNDLAYSGGNNYADGLVHEKGEGMIRDAREYLVPSVEGGTVRTDPLYIVYRNIIEEQIRDHPGVSVINMSKHGAFIAGTKACIAG